MGKGASCLQATFFCRGFENWRFAPPLVLLLPVPAASRCHETKVARPPCSDVQVQHRYASTETVPWSSAAASSAVPRLSVFRFAASSWSDSACAAAAAAAALRLRLPALRPPPEAPPSPNADASSRLALARSAASSGVATRAVSLKDGLSSRTGVGACAVAAPAAPAVVGAALVPASSVCLQERIGACGHRADRTLGGSRHGCAQSS